jgi:glycosyltransferase involved in cell wall biosynthesis
VPKVSIIMPTFNRADTIGRAILSAQAQTLTDWELIIVDDGSTDGTAALIPTDDPRIKVIRQPNGGFVAARDRGMRAAVGDYVAFLDSDDELRNFHLEFASAFLDAHPDEQFVTHEGQEVFGPDQFRFHYRIETSEWYPQKAAEIGSHSFDLPPGETDDYMRVYTSRHPIGAWGADILARAGIDRQCFHYSGNIFEHLRWGFVVSVNSMVVRRKALSEAGFLDPRYGLAADQALVCVLAGRFNTNFMGVPSYFKHEFASGGAIPSEGHLVTGKSALRFYDDMLLTFDDFFMRPRPMDPELRAIRSLMLLDNAQVALRAGLRPEALEFLRAARLGLPHLRRARTLSWFAQLVPWPRLAEKLWRRSHEMLSKR